MLGKDPESWKAVVLRAGVRILLFESGGTVPGVDNAFCDMIGSNGEK